MSIQKMIQESIQGNPLGVKKALSEELRVRVGKAIEEKVAENLDENIGGLFKNASEWERSAKDRGLVVKPATHPSGEATKYQIAKDKEGNNRGHFDHGTKSGHLKEEVELDEGLEFHDRVGRNSKSTEIFHKGKHVGTISKHYPRNGRPEGYHTVQYHGSSAPKGAKGILHHERIDSHDDAKKMVAKHFNESVELSEADKPTHQFYATTQYINPSEMKLLHDKKKPFATEKDAFAHIKNRGGRQDGSIHKVHTATGKIVSIRHVAGGQAGYVSDVGRGDPKSVNELK